MRKAPRANVGRLSLIELQAPAAYRKPCEAQEGFEIYTCDDLLNYRDPDVGKITVSNGVLTLGWRYPYTIRLARIETPLDVIQWITHLSAKNWMTSHRLALFARAVCQAKGWCVRLGGRAKQ